MKLKRIEIRNIFETISTIKNGVNKFSFKTDYALSKNIRLLQPVYSDIMTAQKKLIDEIPPEYIKEKTEGKVTFDMTKINGSDALKPLNDFMEEEEEVEVFLIDGEGLFPEKNEIGNAVDILYPLFAE